MWNADAAATLGERMPTRRLDILCAAVCVAAVDRAMCDREREILDVLARAAKLEKQSLDALINRALHDEDYYAEQLRMLHARPVEIIALLLTVARADGRVSLDERVLIRFFAGKLGMSESAFERSRALADDGESIRRMFGI